MEESSGLITDSNAMSRVGRISFIKGHISLNVGGYGTSISLLQAKEEIPGKLGVADCFVSGQVMFGQSCHFSFPGVWVCPQQNIADLSF